jgi:HEAT repeat protein
MPKRDVEQQLVQLSRLGDGPVSDAAISTLSKALTDRVNLVVAKAAQVAATLQLRPLIPGLLAAYERLFHSGAEDDPQCTGKRALIQALINLDYDEAAPFLRGYRYVQMEAVYRTMREDSAAPLRSLCTLGLVQCTDLSRAAKLRHLVTVMSDEADAVRIDAIRAIEQMDGEEAALLCRLKAGVGDQSPVVTGQAIEAVLDLEGERALDFAQTFLASPDEPLAEEAALAMGASRLPAAIKILEEAFARHPRPIFLRAISIARLDAGFAVLLGLIRDGDAPAAALDALAIHRGSMEIETAVHEAVIAQNDEALLARYRAKFKKT